MKPHQVAHGKHDAIDNIKLFSAINDENVAHEIKGLLELADAEFVPPLSSRRSTTDTSLAGDNARDCANGIDAYFDSIRHQPALVALSGHHVVGFMSFKRNIHMQKLADEPLGPDQSDDAKGPNVYITTVITHPEFRGYGVATGLYAKLIERYGKANIFTRTWSTNVSHMGILRSHGFHKWLVKDNDRGPGIDTVYFHRPARGNRFRKTIEQHHLGGNVLGFITLFVFWDLSLGLWLSTYAKHGVANEIWLAVFTSLLASMLCLISDIYIKYQDSKNDTFINNLTHFGISGIQFHKDELLEELIPKCRHELWISGYRLHMTAQQSFLEAIKKGCARHPGIEIRVLLVPQWSETYRNVYGNEDVIENYVQLTSLLLECWEQYGTKVCIRITDKPVFNDTYKVDGRFITGPYLHCGDGHRGKIKAKDFYALDISDEQSELYGRILNDYEMLWDTCTGEIDSTAARQFAANVGKGMDEEAFRALFKAIS